MPRKHPSQLNCPQRSHPRFSADDAEERTRERQRQNRARRRAVKTSNDALVTPVEDERWAESPHVLSEEEGPEHPNERKIIASDLDHARRVRFAHDKDEDPQVTHRRRLDAIRAKNYRNRRKNEQCVGANTSTRYTPAIGPPCAEPACTDQVIEATYRRPHRHLYLRL
ncbi:hypothetical protein N7532_002979 [Penicillium argentinense]|uniref:Uncharacterized protein n=1 Tax=Penicillium argentinense TaxID=1131581 RepID=A0A9W9KDH2_9EURO|nr:uncharacterized protein N7532_002979 [Penicillium argentinense]KAJ5102450.1 hypothetical protein N7532_002979 [Penicillium argentinense]